MDDCIAATGDTLRQVSPGGTDLPIPTLVRFHDNYSRGFFACLDIRVVPFSEKAGLPELEPISPRKVGRRHVVSLLLIAYWLFLLVVLASRVNVWFELASHFVWQAILGGAALILLCLWQRRWKILGLALVPWCYLIVLFQPWNLWLGSPQVIPEHRAQRLTVMSWNVLCINENLEEIRRVVEQHPVDILVLVEVRPNLFQQIPQLDEMYKYRMAYPSWGGNGIALLTNRSDVQLSRVDFGGRIMPSIVASVGQSLQVIGVHTWSPFPPQRAVPRDRQLADLTSWVQQQASPVCVVGDLNVTPWAPSFQKLLAAGMIDSRNSGFGNSASWPSWLGPLGIPIDHALSHGPCTVTSRKLGPMVYGSDHRPLLVEIAY